DYNVLLRFSGRVGTEAVRVEPSRIDRDVYGASHPLDTDHLRAGRPFFDLVERRRARPFGKRFNEQTLVTEEEVTALVRQGTEAGVFHQTEQELVEAVFQLGDKSARGLMTPRSQIVWLDVIDSPERIQAKLSTTGHSRFPVCDGGLD